MHEQILFRPIDFSASKFMLENEANVSENSLLLFANIEVSGKNKSSITMIFVAK